jgi:hypothetical protein
MFGAFAKRCRNKDWDIESMKEAIVREEVFSKGHMGGDTAKVVVDSGAISAPIARARALLDFENA